MSLFAFALLFAAVVAGYMLNRMAAAQIRAGGTRTHSLAGFHGLFSALVVGLPGFILLILWLLFQGPVIDRMIMGGLPAGTTEGLETGPLQLILAEIKSISRGQVFGTPEQWKVEAAERYVSLHATSRWMMVTAVAVLSLLLLVFARSRVSAEFRARQGVEGIVLGLMIFCSTVAIFTTVGIVLSLVYESWAFFRLIPLHEFLFGLQWEPQIAIRADQIAGAGAFGVVPVFLGTIVIMVIALTFAVPIGLFSAIYLNEFAAPRTRNIIKPVLEILAGIPTIVYGFFAVITVSPFLRNIAAAIGIDMAPTRSHRRRRGDGHHADPVHLLLRRRRLECRAAVLA
jgi:phosphate transport system permease protein